MLRHLFEDIGRSPSFPGAGASVSACGCLSLDIFNHDVPLAYTLATVEHTNAVRPCWWGSSTFSGCTISGADSSTVALRTYTLSRMPLKRHERAKEEEHKGRLCPGKIYVFNGPLSKDFLIKASRNMQNWLLISIYCATSPTSIYLPTPRHCDACRLQSFTPWASTCVEKPYH